jgi:hypothetical protein
MKSKLCHWCTFLVSPSPLRIVIANEITFVSKFWSSNKAAYMHICMYMYVGTYSPTLDLFFVMRFSLKAVDFRTNSSIFGQIHRFSNKFIDFRTNSSIFRHAWQQKRKLNRFSKQKQTQKMIKPITVSFLTELFWIPKTTYIRYVFVRSWCIK